MFCIYELVEMILSDLPALDLLVLQMVNRTCRDVVNQSHEFQRKLFMKQDPPEDDGELEKEFDANELRWNPFLEHFAESLEPGRKGIRIKRKHLREHDHANASWKRMFMSYPPRMYFYAHFEGRWLVDGVPNCPYKSKVLAENMEFLAEADRECCDHKHHGNRSTENYFVIKAWEWRELRVCKVPEKLLRSNEELELKNIENEGCDEISISKDR